MCEEYLLATVKVAIHKATRNISLKIKKKDKSNLYSKTVRKGETVKL